MWADIIGSLASTMQQDTSLYFLAKPFLENQATTAVLFSSGVFLSHCLMWISISWGYFFCVLTRWLLISSRSKKLRQLVSSGSPQRTFEIAGDMRSDLVARVVHLTSFKLLKGTPPEKAYFAGHEVILEELRRLPFWWTISIIVLLVLNISGSIAFGTFATFLAYFDMADAFADSQHLELWAGLMWRCVMVLACLTAFPGVLSALMLATVASARRQRKLAIQLVEKMTGLKAAKIDYLPLPSGDD